mmetsp:Transcript_41968/g.91107  ORF Transcript_41968/g.91107 Transcript_41968/m.91107 type:complete len:226 (-) Transcript_41968:144-821(-)
MQTSTPFSPPPGLTPLSDVELYDRFAGVVDACGSVTTWPADERELLRQFIIHAADLGHAFKPTAASKDNVRRLLSEFFAQGDKEKALDLPISFDRHSFDIAKGQVLHHPNPLHPDLSSDFVLRFRHGADVCGDCQAAAGDTGLGRRRHGQPVVLEGRRSWHSHVPPGRHPIHHPRGLPCILSPLQTRLLPRPRPCPPKHARASASLGTLIFQPLHSHHDPPCTFP